MKKNLLFAIIASTYIAGHAASITVPFTHSLGKDETITSEYMAIDANDDSRTWKPGGFTSYSVCMSANEETADDWLISPAVTLEAGKTYGVSFDYDMTLNKTEDKLALFAGTTRTTDGMIITVIPEFAYEYNSKVFRTKSGSISVTETGDYYFGFHCTSEKSKTGTPKVCNFSIAEREPDIIIAPGPGKLEITAAPKGELKATVKYTAPTVNKEGGPLTQLTQAVITVNGTYKTILTDIKPGVEYTFETTNVSNSANNTFEAIAYSGEEAGEPVSVKGLFFGPDLPLPPTNVNATLSDDFTHVTVTWDPIGEIGENGGYVDTSNVVYYIFDAYGSIYDAALATTRETTYTFDYSKKKGQDFIAYQITAGVGESYSLDEASNIVVIGNPESLPYYESFADGHYSQAWAYDLDGTGNVYIGAVHDNELQTNEDPTLPEYMNSHDADNGFFYMMPGAPATAHGMFSTKIDISGAENPVFEFRYQGSGSKLDAKLAAGTPILKTIKSIDLKEEPAEEWTLCCIDLKPYQSAGYVQIGLLMRAGEDLSGTAVDNVRVIDLKDQDMRISAASAPASVYAGEEIPVVMTFENIGLQALTSAHMTVNVDGEDCEPVKFATLAPGEIATARVAVSTSPLSADNIAVKAYAKSAEGNIHHTLEQNVAIKFTDHPMPTDVIATAEGRNAHLSWNAPELGEMTEPIKVEEDFEGGEAKAFSYQGYGEFQFLDLDGGKTYSFFNDVNNPYRNKPMAYQVYTPELSGMPEDYRQDAETHSWKTMLAAWSCNGQNSNLLISPRLSGEEQTVSFWARGFTEQEDECETFSVWVSDTDAQTSSFAKVKEIENYNGIVSEVWTEYKFTVPAGTNYFAILHDSYNSWALFLDDFSFSQANVLPVDTELTGYNLYCNGKKVSETAETTAAHSPEDNGTYDYRLTAVYNNGESRATEPVSIELSEEVSAAEIGNGVKIECHDHFIYVTAPEGIPVSIVSINGRILASGRGNLCAAVPAEKVVIVSVGSFTAKVSVK